MNITWLIMWKDLSTEPNVCQRLRTRYSCNMWGEGGPPPRLSFQPTFYCWWLKQRLIWRHFIPHRGTHFFFFFTTLGHWWGIFLRTFSVCVIFSVELGEPSWPSPNPASESDRCLDLHLLPQWCMSQLVLCNKVSQTRGLNSMHLFSHRSGGWKSENTLFSRVGFFWGLSPWLVDRPPSLPVSSCGCPSMHVCVLISSSYKDISHVLIRSHPNDLFLP